MLNWTQIKASSLTKHTGRQPKWFNQIRDIISTPDIHDNRHNINIPMQSSNTLLQLDKLNSNTVRHSKFITITTNNEIYLEKI